MGSRGDLDLGASVHGRDLHRTAQQGRRYGDVQVVDQVVAVADQFRIGFLLDDDLQVAVHAALTGRIALAGDREDHPLAHTGRDLDLDDLLAAQRSFALALVARRRDHLARAAARRADALSLHPSEEGVFHARNVSRSVAGRAGCIGVCILGTRAAALVARHGLVDLEFLGDARGDLGKRQPNPHTDVRPAVDAARAASRRAESAAEVSAEDIAELREDVLHGESPAAETSEASGTAACRAAHSGVSELVVTGPLVGIRQHVIGFGGLLELLFGLLVPGVFVRVVFDRGLSVGLLDLVGVGISLDAEHFVIISLFCHGLTLLRQP